MPWHDLVLRDDLTTAQYALREYRINLALGGTPHNSRVSAGILTANKFGISRVFALAELDQALRRAGITVNG